MLKDCKKCSVIKGTTTYMWTFTASCLMDALMVFLWCFQGSGVGDSSGQMYDFWSRTGGIWIPQLCQDLAKWPWASYLPSLGLSFITCQIEIIMIIFILRITWLVVRVPWADAWSAAWDVINIGGVRFVVVLAIDTAAYLMGQLDEAGVTIKNRVINFVKCFSFFLIYIETILDENKCATFEATGAISPKRK